MDDHVIPHVRPLMKSRLEHLLLQPAQEKSRLLQPLDAQNTFNLIKQAARDTENALPAYMQGKITKEKNQITQYFLELSSIGLTDFEHYKNGGELTFTVEKPQESKIASAEAIGKLIQGAELRLHYVQKLNIWIPGIIAAIIIVFTIAALFEFAISKFLGDNGTISDLTFMAWGISISGAITLAVSAASLYFFKKIHHRLAPWGKWIVFLATVFILVRYIAMYLTADYEFMAELSPEWIQAIRLLRAIGTGVSLLILDMAAGRLLSLAVLYYQQKTNDIPQLRNLLQKAQLWQEHRQQLSQMSAPIPDVSPSAITAVGVALVNEYVSAGLQEFRNIAVQKMMDGDALFTGCAHDHINADFHARIADCDKALTELTQLQEAFCLTT